MKFRKATKSEAKSIKEQADPEWKRLLRAGETLIMDKRPNWSIHDSHVLRSKKVGDEVAIWLEEKDPIQQVLDDAMSDDAEATEPVFEGGDDEDVIPPNIEPQEPTEEVVEETDLTRQAADIFG